MEFWRTWFEGYIVGETEGWLKIKRRWWSRAVWLPKNGFMTRIQELIEREKQNV
jgi:hypothetical protein